MNRISFALFLTMTVGLTACGITTQDLSTGSTDAAEDAGAVDNTADTGSGVGGEDAGADAGVEDIGSVEEDAAVGSDAGDDDAGDDDASMDGGMDAGTMDTGIQPKPKTSVAIVTADDLTVELLTDTQIETGMTPMYLKITTSSGEAVTDATVTFLPMMYMTSGKNHSAPVIGTPTLDTDGFYRIAVVFQMPSGMMGYWDMQTTVQRPGGDVVAATFPKVTVAESGRATVLAYTDPVTSVVKKYVTSLNLEAAPVVGLNPVIFTLHTPAMDMMSFAPVEGATLVLEPKETGTGSGCAGSVNPTHTSLGRYAGKVNFDKVGTWETTVTVTVGGAQVGTPKFTTTF